MTLARLAALSGLALGLCSMGGNAALARQAHAGPSSFAPDSAGPAKSTLIDFKDACAPGDRITILATGDLLFHRPLQQQALTPNGSYQEFWSPVAGVLASADLTYANFEGTAAEGIALNGAQVKDPGRAWNNSVYTAATLVLNYNYHPSLIDDLIASGFDVVSTANNHAMDRGVLGIDRTVDNMRSRGLGFSGTRKKGETDHPFSIITKVKGWNVAWLACTFDLNGYRDSSEQVLNCYRQKDDVLAEIRRLAAEPTIDAVILTPHWGTEGSSQPDKRARDLAQDAAEAGAAAIIGTHPHVQGPWDKIVTADGREVLVVYSTGNFISNQRRFEQREGEMVLVELAKTPGAGKARVSAAGYVSTWVDITSVHRVVEASHAQISRVLPPGNHVAIADLPHLPRTCGEGQKVAESWGQPQPATLALLPLATAGSQTASTEVPSGAIPVPSPAVAPAPAAVAGMSATPIGDFREPPTSRVATLTPAAGDAPPVPQPALPVRNKAAPVVVTAPPPPPKVALAVPAPKPVKRAKAPSSGTSSKLDKSIYKPSK